MIQPGLGELPWGEDTEGIAETKAKEQLKEFWYTQIAVNARASLYSTGQNPLTAVGVLDINLAPCLWGMGTHKKKRGVSKGEEGWLSPSSNRGVVG